MDATVAPPLRPVSTKLPIIAVKRRRKKCSISSSSVAAVVLAVMASAFISAFMGYHASANVLRRYTVEPPVADTPYVSPAIPSDDLSLTSIKP